jgi:CBS domain containing-hemolysin-like protein
LEPPSSPFDNIEFETWINLVFTCLSCILLFIASAVSGAVARNELKNRQNENRKFLFVFKNRTVLNESLQTLQTLLFVVITLMIDYSLSRLNLQAYHFIVLSVILLILWQLTLLFKYVGINHFQKTVLFFYPFIRLTGRLLIPVTGYIYKNINNLNESAEEGQIRETDRILQNTADVEVKEIVSSRMDIVAVNISTGFSELLDVVVESGYSRLPVYEGDIDHVKGILYVKDLLPYMREKNGDFDWKKLIHSAYFVSEYNKINALLEEMKQNRAHIAVVVDEYGMTTGIVTLEDILEEIVGDIFDESDVEAEEKFYVKHKDNSYSFKGKTHIMDFCKIMQIDNKLFDAVKGDSETLAGLLLEYKGEFLQKDEIIDIEGFSFKVESVDARRIRKIRVIKNDEKNDENF